MSRLSFWLGIQTTRRDLSAPKKTTNQRMGGQDRSEVVGQRPRLARRPRWHCTSPGTTEDNEPRTSSAPGAEAKGQRSNPKESAKEVAASLPSELLEAVAGCQVGRTVRYGTNHQEAECPPKHEMGRKDVVPAPPPMSAGPKSCPAGLEIFGARRRPAPWVHFCPKIASLSCDPTCLSQTQPQACQPSPPSLRPKLV